MLSLPLLNVEAMVRAFGQDEETAAAAGTYVKVCIPGVLLYSWQTCYSRFLSGQRITVVPMYSNITATIVHVGLSIVLTVNGGMGLMGIAIASSVQFAVRFIMTYGYIRLCGKFDDPAIQVPIFHVDSLRHWKSQFFLSLQCMSLSVWSWWAMDVFTLIASYMPPMVITA